MSAARTSASQNRPAQAAPVDRPLPPLGERALPQVQRRMLERLEPIVQPVLVRRLDPGVADQQSGELGLGAEGDRLAAIIRHRPRIAPHQPLLRRRDQEGRGEEDVVIGGDPPDHQRVRHQRHRSQPALGPSDRDMHLGKRLRAGVGEHQPRRRRGLRLGQLLGELEPVDRDLLAGDEQHPRRAAAGADHRPFAAVIPGRARRRRLSWRCLHSLPIRLRGRRRPRSRSHRAARPAPARCSDRGCSRGRWAGAE